MACEVEEIQNMATVSVLNLSPNSDDDDDQDDESSQNSACSDLSSDGASIAPAGGVGSEIKCNCNINKPDINSTSETPEPPDASKFDTSTSDSITSQEPSPKCCLKRRCAMFLDNGWLSDITFIVGEGEQRQKIHAHKVFLASGSDVFKTMFCENWSSESGEIKVPDVDPAAFLALLRYLYTDEISVMPDTVAGTLYAAKKYSILPLEDFCFNFLMEHLCPENAFAVLTHARLFDETRLIDACLNVIDNDTEASISAQGFLDIDSALLLTILERDSLSIREVQLFEAVLRWSKAECERLDMAVNEGNQRAVLKELLPLVRFPLMSIKEIASVVAPANVVPKDDLLSIYSYLSINPKPFVHFNTTPRYWEKFKVYRFQEVAAGFEFQNDLELGEFIVFKVSNEVQFHGVGLYGSVVGPAHYSVDLILRCYPYDEILQQEITDYDLDGSSVTFEALFKKPVKLKPNIDHRVFVKMKGQASFYGKKGVGEVEVPLPHGRSVTVTFSTWQPTKTRRTNIKRGQIPELIFTT